MNIRRGGGWTLGGGERGRRVDIRRGGEWTLGGEESGH